jgi:hypothetical protein
MKKAAIFICIIVLCSSYALANCNHPYRLGQVFVSKGPEVAKGNMIQVQPGSGVIQSWDITNCNSQSLTYSFKAARYAGTHKDAAIVRIKVTTDNGKNEYYDEIIDSHTTDYSKINSALDDGSIQGSLTWSGSPAKLEIFVTPGDWGIEIRKFHAQFEN